MRAWLTVLLLILIAGCSSPSHTLIPQASDVQIHTQVVATESNCQWIGEVTGSEGHWYNYLFYPNATMIEGALIDLKNHAQMMGANRVALLNPHNFQTSVTLVGTAYHCEVAL